MLECAVRFPLALVYFHVSDFLALRRSYLVIEIYRIVVQKQPLCYFTGSNHESCFFLWYHCDEIPGAKDIDLNSIYRCTDPAKQAVSQTMLNHELALMQQADFAQSGSFGFQHEPCRYSAFMQKPVDLQLSADEFISYYADDFLGKEPPKVSFKNFMAIKDFSRGVMVSDVDNIKLSLGLSVGQSKAKDNRSERNKSCVSFSEVIDLEEPNFGLPKNNTSHELPSHFAAAKCSSKDKHKLESFLQIGVNHNPYVSPARESISGVGPSRQRPPASFSGCIAHHKEFLSADLFSENQTSGTCKPKNLDLNVVQFEYSSCVSNNFSMVQNPSRTSFSCVTEKTHGKRAIISSSSLTYWSKANVIDLSESSAKHRQFDLNIDFTKSCGENNEGGWNKGDKFRTTDSGGICVIDLDSDSGEPCSSNKSNPKIESVDSSSKFLNNVQNQVADEIPSSPKLTSSSGSDHLNDDQSNNLKTVQSEETVGPLVDNREPDRKSSDNTESNIQYMSNKKLEADEMAQKAAESLVKISLETRVCHHGLANEFLDKDNQPQCSSDSYEKMVLWAKESEVDDFCASSNAFVVDGPENKVSRYKLKRGTRLKDFRKDVLPSLSILSRHEISEDINIMEGVIRSREYKKMKAKMVDDGEWFRAGRSKRSRAGYNRRYHQ